MNCSCGEILGFLFKCVKCDGSCCIYCTPADINVEICPKCYVLEKKQIEKLEKKQIEKLEQKEMEKICKFTDCNNTVLNRKCGNCRIQLEYCYIHANYCNDTTAKSKGSNMCKLALCPTHLRCYQHPNICSVCKKDFKNNSPRFKCTKCYKSKTCDDIKCIESNFPMHDIGIYICKNHHSSRCSRCNKLSYISKCNYPNCHMKYMCLRCNIVNSPTNRLEKPLPYYVSKNILKKFSTYKDFVILCDNHKQKCIYCDSVHPKIKLTLPSTFNDWYSIDHGHPQRKYTGCPKCFNSTITGIDHMQKFLTAKNITLPKEIKRMIVSKLI
jgi:hypothetical protein